MRVTNLKEIIEWCTEHESKSVVYLFMIIMEYCKLNI